MGRPRMEEAEYTAPGTAGEGVEEVEVRRPRDGQVCPG